MYIYIYIYICIYVKEISCLVKERTNIYRQNIVQPQYRQLTVQLKNIYVFVETESFICFLVSRSFQIINH